MPRGSAVSAPPPDLFALCASSVRPPLYRSAGGWRAAGARGQELAPLRPMRLEEAISQAGPGESAAAAVALLHSCRHPRQGAQLGRLLQRFGLHQGLVLLHGVGLRPACPRPRLRREASSPRCWRPIWKRAATRAGAALPPAGDAGRAGIDSPGTPAPRTRSSRPRRCLVAPSSWRAAFHGRSSFPHGRHPPPDVSMPAGRPAGKLENGRGRWRLQEEVAWSGWRRRRSRFIRLQAERLRSTPWRPGWARGSTSMPRLQVGRPRPGAGSRARLLLTARGGPLTITDANLLLSPAGAAFPAGVRAPARDRPDPELVEASCSRRLGRAGRPGDRDGRARLKALAGRSPGDRPTNRMAEAIRRISIQRGHDIRGCHLGLLRGGGGQHGLRPRRAAGIFRSGCCSIPGRSASPMHRPADSAAARRRWCVKPFDAAAGGTGCGSGPPRLVEANSRPRGEFQCGVAARASELNPAVAPGCGAGPAARRSSGPIRQRFGHGPERRRPEVRIWWGVACLVELRNPGPRTRSLSAQPPSARRKGQGPTHPLYWGGEVARRFPCHRREASARRSAAERAGAVVEANGSLVLAPGWRAELQRRPRFLLLTHTESRLAMHTPSGSEGRPIRSAWSMFNHRFSAAGRARWATGCQQSAAQLNNPRSVLYSPALSLTGRRLVRPMHHTFPVHLARWGPASPACWRRLRRGDHQPLRPAHGIVSKPPRPRAVTQPARSHRDPHACSQAGLAMGQWQ